MYSDTDEHEVPFDMERLIADAVGEVLAHEDPQRFLTWLRAHIADYYTGLLAEPLGELFPGSATGPDELMVVPPELLRSLAFGLGRSIWNGMPLPGNGFRPRPLPAPHRDDPCPCGSGHKYKQCCAGAPELPLGTESLWPLVLARLPARVVRHAIAQGKVPVEPLAGLAQEYLEEDRPRKGLVLLEPLFDGEIRNTHEAYDYALNVLCNLYDDLGHGKKKDRLLAHVVDTVARSPLRSGAWQRLSAIHMDAGDAVGAWAAFRQAQQDSPDSSGLGVLEVQLLMVEHRLAEAQERAGFWVRRMSRQGFDEDDPGMIFVQAVAHDPAEAFATLGLEMAGGVGERLRDWLQEVAERPMGGYRATREPGELAGDLRAELRTKLAGMGVGDEQMDAVLDAMVAQAETLVENPPEEALAEPPDSLFLEPQPEIGALEMEWHDVFPLPKPFSVHDEPAGDEDVWEPLAEDEWMAWLEEHPAAFDSLDILDDLASALGQHPELSVPWLDESLLGPALRRAAAIVEHALKGAEEGRLAWTYTGNRPGLRSLLRLVYLEQRNGHDKEARRVGERLLALNPQDNHGVRCLVMNAHLRAGDDEAALALAQRYAGDFQPELAYGQVLALCRLDRLDEAQAALCAARERLPKVVRHLTADRVRKPKVDPVNVRIGGEDQAWIYRDEMREVWQATPGVLDWLKKAEKRCKQVR